MNNETLNQAAVSLTNDILLALHGEKGYGKATEHPALLSIVENGLQQYVAGRGRQLREIIMEKRAAMGMPPLYSREERESIRNRTMAEFHPEVLATELAQKYLTVQIPHTIDGHCCVQFKVGVQSFKVGLADDKESAEWTLKMFSKALANMVSELVDQ